MKKNETHYAKQLCCVAFYISLCVHMKDISGDAGTYIHICYIRLVIDEGREKGF